ncbi:hypothetical protein QWY28_15040 [Nocardioides sp. SOB77]|uniref:Integral membrane protein n=1 Tax=Nocardioides oceani TaxID=3058369 RepID=A0ABT8FHY1_9ACTN|nr:hypothetical protein [Nocardioides oceani]MDN4174278.1 hypothetical protein [Nocardioides oceani]
MDDLDTAPGEPAGRRGAASPVPLTVATALVAAEGAVLALLAVAELVHLTPGRVTMNVTTTGFFLLCGAALLLCAAGLRRHATWSRSPSVLAQLITLGVAWSFRGGDTTLLALGLALVAAVVLVGLLHPSSTAVLVDDPTGTAGRADEPTS